MKTLLKIFVLAIGGSALFSVNQSLAEAGEQKQNVAPNHYPAGSYENPVVPDLRQIKNYEMLEIAQDDYIRKNYEGYRILGRSYTMHGERYILTLTLTEEGEEIDADKLKMVYFDVTDAYKKLRSKDRNSREKIKGLEDKHKPMTKEELIERMEKRQKGKGGKPRK